MSTTTRWNKQRWMAVGAVAAAATMVLGACGSDNNSATSSTNTTAPAADVNEQARDNVKDGGKLTQGLDEISPQWNAFQADATLYSQNLWQMYNPVLFTSKADGTSVPNPSYLTSFTTEVKNGNTVSTYTINDKAVFNDGTPIDWTAFKTTWEANNGKNPDYSASSTDGYSRITSVVEGASPKQAVVTYAGVFAWTDTVFGLVLHPKVNNPDFYNKGYIDTPHNELGAGPYELASYDKINQTVSFKRNLRWWGPRGKLDEFVYRGLQTDAAVNAFKAGETDYIDSLTSKELLARVQGTPNTEIRRSVRNVTRLLTLNTKSPVLGDAEVRKAILMAVDRPTLARVNFQGIGYSEKVPGSLSLYPFQPGYNDNVAGVIDYRVEEAKKALDAAGWRPGSDGVREKDGKRLELTLPQFDSAQAYSATLQALQAMEQKIGVKVNIVQKLGPTDFSDVFKNRSFDIVYSAISGGSEGFAFFCQFWCSNSTLNKSGGGSAADDTKIQDLTKIPEKAAQIQAGNRLERELFGQYTVLPLMNGPQNVAVRTGLANIGASAFFGAPVENVGYQK